MEQNKMTAVEWLEFMVKGMIDNGGDFEDLICVMDHIQEAKQVEKGQMEYMFECGRNFQLTGEGTFTRVYNETYGTK